jgi:hypothetical protein
MNSINELILHLSALGEVKNSQLLLESPKSYTPRSVGVDNHLIIQYGLLRGDSAHYVRFSSLGLHKLIDFFNIDLSKIQSVFDEYYAQSYDYGLITNKADFDTALAEKLSISRLEYPVVFDILNGVDEYGKSSTRKIDLSCYIQLSDYKDPTIIFEMKFPYSTKENFIYRYTKSLSGTEKHYFSKIFSTNIYSSNHIKHVEFDFDDLSNVMFKKYFSQRMIQIIHANLGYSRAEIGKNKQEIVQCYELMKMVKI